jgi:1-acyl-sn-glycerol-3-phosphate acyltransferase
MHHRGARVWGTDPGMYDPGLARRTFGRLRPLFQPHGYFPIDARGWENIPPSPALLVCNHSGGTMVTDVWGLAFAWYDKLGWERPIHAVTHEIILATDATGSFFSRLGAVRGSPAIALDLLTRRRRDLLVFPGGDLDAWRPHADRYRVRFEGRTGYARTAIRAQVPIVPVAHAGAHETLYVFTDGRRFAKALRFHDIFRADIFPIHLSLPWILGIGPLPHLPTPVTFRYRFGEAIAPPSWRGAGDPPPELVRELDAQVRTSVQELLNGLAREELER